VARAVVSAVIDAPVDAVWDVLGDFNGLPEYASRIATSELEDASGRGPVGAVRRMTRAADGSTVRERLLHYDNPSRSLSYEFVGSHPVSARNYVGRVQAWPVTTTGATFVEWTGTFDVDEADETAARAFFEQVFSSFLGGLADRLAKPAEASSGG
jgi:hypothetical protein